MMVSMRPSSDCLISQRKENIMYTNRFYAKEGTMRRTQGQEKLLADLGYVNSSNSFHYLRDHSGVARVTVLISTSLNDLTSCLEYDFWDHTKNPAELEPGDLVMVLPNKTVQKKNPKEEGIIFELDHHEKISNDPTLWK